MTGVAPGPATGAKKAKTTGAAAKKPVAAAPEDDDDDDDEDDEDDEKSKMKRNADDRRGAKDSKLSVGDIVLVRQPHKNKLSAPFDSRPLKITARKGNMVTARRGRYTITRNIAHFKYVPLVAFRDGVNDQRENDDDQRENDDDQPVNDNDQPVNDDVQPRPMRRATIPLRFRDFVMHV